MKNLFIALACLFSFNLFAQDAFNGVWKQDYSEYLLIIDLSADNNKEVALYNPATNDIYYQNITLLDNNRIITYKSFDDNSEYSVLYELTNSKEIYCNLNNETILTYKKQE